MDAQGARVVAGLLAERLEAGWRPGEIMSAMDQALPARVGRLSSLVASRLKANVDPVMAPAGMVAVAEDERREASRRRSEALADDPGQQREADPRFAAALKRAKASLGEGASRLDVAMEAHRLLDVDRAAVGAGDGSSGAAA